MKEKLLSLSVAELREIAKEKGIHGVSNLRKQQLVEMILEVEGKTEHKDEVPNEQGETRTGILEVMPDGFGFIRCDNYLPGDDDVYVAPSQIRRFRLKTGDFVTGRVRARRENEKFGALYYVDQVNGLPLDKVLARPNFEDLTPIFPDDRLHLETKKASTAMRIVDLLSPIGKGQRGMIVSPPKAGKTTLLKETAKAILENDPEMEIIILLIDERPEEVTDMKETVKGDNVEVIYSTFDELPEHHKRVSEMVIERAKRLVEHGKDVTILLDSITRLARAYNMTIPPSGRTLSGGLDPAALHMPKRFFGAARNMREGGSLTILATALVDTGSKMDDVVFEEFKGTGNMELVLDRRLSEKRVFPAIDIVKSGTRREDLLLSKEEEDANNVIRKLINGMRKDDAVEQVLTLFAKSKNNAEVIDGVSKIKL
ncbi:MAG: transcription termination factor Rho [Eubacterium sp.]|nr:transcription termination factor Rho [Eubacterium sp.]